MTVAIALLALPIVLIGYAYVAYPLMLKVLASRRPVARQVEDPEQWPMITITVPCYNEAASIRRTLEQLLALDYPADRRQILVISDASSDGTDAIVREFAPRGVELLRMPTRVGKTAAESAAARFARGDIVVNVDATIMPLPHALKPLVRAFRDRSVGVASGRDISIGDQQAEGTRGESTYVGYEMWVRGLETRIDSIVGASGCFYAFRRELYDTTFPHALSRDFGAPLIAAERGLRSVSVDEALCLVPRTTSLRTELRRKIRTMHCGMETLWHKRHLLNPRRHGFFAVMLLSHKVARWLVYAALPGAVLALIVLSVESEPARLVLALCAAGALLGVLALRWPEGRPVPKVLGLAGFVLTTSLAGMMAWLRFFRRETSAFKWEPTRRSTEVHPPLTTPPA